MLLRSFFFLLTMRSMTCAHRSQVSQRRPIINSLEERERAVRVQVDETSELCRIWMGFGGRWGGDGDVPHPPVGMSHYHEHLRWMRHPLDRQPAAGGSATTPPGFAFGCRGGRIFPRSPPPSRALPPWPAVPAPNPPIHGSVGCGPSSSPPLHNLSRGTC